MEKLQKAENAQPRILLHSQRNIFPPFHYRIGLVEFEDIVREIDSVDLIAPKSTSRFHRYGNRIASKITCDFNMAVNPGIPLFEVEKSYDLFLAVTQFPKDLLHLNYVKGWKENCKVSICWLNEFWISKIYKYRYFLKILNKFNYVILTQKSSLEKVQEKISGQCHYMPLGIDAILFCPSPNPPQRVVDVYSIGRRSEDTHQALLEMSRKSDMFYIYDTIMGEQVKNPFEHRQLFTNMTKRSRYFIVNPGKIDTPDETQGQSEFGNRFFEGAAAGTIMIGQGPRNEEFEKHFNWPGSIVHLPYGSKNIGNLIKDLENDVPGSNAIRKNNIVNSLGRHDWVYRWEELLEIAGLKPAPGAHERKKRLQDLIKSVRAEMR